MYSFEYIESQNIPNKPKKYDLKQLFKVKFKAISKFNNVLIHLF